MVRIGIGFSTTRWPLSWMIRKITKCDYSHTWLYVEEDGNSTVWEASFEGFRPIPYGTWKKNQLRVLVKDYPNQEAIQRAFQTAKTWLNEPYDYGGLIGELWVQIGSWFRKKWHNPLQNSHMLYCSEAVSAVVKMAGYQGTEQLIPSDTPPAACFRLMEKERTLFKE